MRFLRVVILGLILTLILGVCTTADSVAGGTDAKIAKLESENHTLSDRVASLENERLTLQAEVASFEQRLSLTYMDYPSLKRFVPMPSQIRALPLNDAIITLRILRRLRKTAVGDKIVSFHRRGCDDGQ